VKEEHGVGCRISATRQPGTRRSQLAGMGHILQPLGRVLAADAQHVAIDFHRNYHEPRTVSFGLGQAVILLNSLLDIVGEFWRDSGSIPRPLRVFTRAWHTYNSSATNA
jgi:hypothetical protein